MVVSFDPCSWLMAHGSWPSSLLNVTNIKVDTADTCTSMNVVNLTRSKSVLFPKMCGVDTRCFLSEVSMYRPRTVFRTEFLGINKNAFRWDRTIHMKKLSIDCWTFNCTTLWKHIQFFMFLTTIWSRSYIFFQLDISVIALVWRGIWK